MKFIRVIKSNTPADIENRIQKVIEDNLEYDYMGDDGMVNPSPLLKKYEDKYEYIRPKEVNWGEDFIEYTSQGFDDPQIMFEMIYEAISKDGQVKKAYDNGELTIKVCSRDNRGNWKEFHN